MSALSEFRSSRDRKQSGDKDDALPTEMHVDRCPTPLRIAFIYSRIPFPLMRGDQLTVSHLISFLGKRGHDVDFYTLNTGGQMSIQQSNWLKSQCTAVNIYEQSSFLKIWGILVGLLKLRPAQIGYFANSKLKRDVTRAVKSGKYDIVYTYYIRSAQAVPNCFSPNQPSLLSGRKCAAFLAMQLSQYLNVGRMAARESSFIRRCVYRLEQKLLAHYEGRIWKSFTKACLIGPKDVEAIASACETSNNPPINNVVFSAHGTDIRGFRISEPADVVPGRIVFSGNMGYRPNIEAAGWFFTNCWSQIKQNAPDASVWIVGRDPSPEVLEYAKLPGVHVTGTVEDIGSYIRSAAVCINPIQAAGGMQNKLVEYLACGSLIVATSISNEGINAPANSIIVKDAPEDFARAVIDAIHSPEKHSSFRRNARIFAEADWSWESHFLRLENEFLNALASH